MKGPFKATYRLSEHMSINLQGRNGTIGVQGFICVRKLKVMKIMVTGV